VAAARRYAEDGQRCTELNLLHAIERFGVQAIMGRPMLYAKEIRSMLLAERVVNVIQAVNNSDDWPAFAREHPKDAALYTEIMKDIE